MCKKRKPTWLPSVPQSWTLLPPRGFQELPRETKRPVEVPEALWWRCMVYDTPLQKYLWSKFFSLFWCHSKKHKSIKSFNQLFLLWPILAQQCFGICEICVEFYFFSLSALRGFWILSKSSVLQASRQCSPSDNLGSITAAAHDVSPDES